MYKKVLLATGIITIALIVAANVFSSKADVVIYTTLEDYRADQLSYDLKQEFPNMNVSINYVSTANLMSKLKNEGTSSNCDIIVGLEATNAEILLKDNPNILHNFTDEFTGDESPKNKYISELLSVIPTTSYDEENNICKYHIFDKEAGCIVINKNKLKDKDGKSFPIPTCFDDLKNDIYKNLICMPDPLFSGTGYYWLNGLTSCWGQENAINYFKDIDKNFVQNGYTTSGSLPFTMLRKGDAGIALAMSFQVSRELFQMKEEEKKDFEMLYFDINDVEGNLYQNASPFTLYTNAVVNQKWQNPAVQKVYRYIYSTWTYKDKYMFDPEIIYKKQYEEDFIKETNKYFGDYPFPTSYMPMKEVFNPDYKISLQEAWKGWKK